jgi:DNA-binding response OmpR family regulator
MIDGRLLVKPGGGSYIRPEIAANENTPVLLLSGDAETNETFRRFGYPYLPKPFSLIQLLSEAKRVIAEANENICSVKAAAARMQASTEDRRGPPF